MSDLSFKGHGIVDQDVLLDLLMLNGVYNEVDIESKPRGIISQSHRVGNSKRQIVIFGELELEILKNL